LFADAFAARLSLFLNFGRHLTMDSRIDDFDAKGSMTVNCPFERETS